jgi:hypothetical protein
MVIKSRRIAWRSMYGVWGFYNVCSILARYPEEKEHLVDVGLDGKVI